MRYQIKNGTVSLQGETVLDHIDFEIRGSEKIALVGKNGAGKTTLLKLIAGELSLTEMINGLTRHFFCQKYDSGECFARPHSRRKRTGRWKNFCWSFALLTIRTPKNGMILRRSMTGFLPDLVLTKKRKRRGWGISPRRTDENCHDKASSCQTGCFCCWMSRPPS